MVLGRVVGSAEACGNASLGTVAVEVGADVEAEVEVPGGFGGALMLELRGGAMGALVEGVEEKREAMHSWMWDSRRVSPAGSSLPQTGHSSSSLISLLARGGIGGGDVMDGRECGRDPGTGGAYVRGKT